VVAVSSLTKCYGLAPARIGWLLGPPEVVACAGDALVASCGMLPLGWAHTALAAFERLGPLAERARAALRGKRERVAGWAAEQGLSWSAPAEGLFGLAMIPGAGDLTGRIEAMARDQQVLVAAGSFFGVPNGFRLAWSAPAELLDEGLHRLSRGLGLR
jgi:aspartate/methionine/tyrosine aminotransferase